MTDDIFKKEPKFAKKYRDRESTPKAYPKASFPTCLSFNQSFHCRWPLNCKCQSEDKAKTTAFHFPENNYLGGNSQNVLGKFIRFL